MDHTVNFRSYKESYQDKRAIFRPPEEWRVFENTHEAIIDQEMWRLAQQARKTVRRTDTTGEANPLTGLVYCVDCGAKMYNHRGRALADKENRGRGPVSGLYPYDPYDCSTYALTFHHASRVCRSHYISTRALRALALDAIRMASAYAISNEAGFIRKVREASEVRQRDAAKELKRKVAKVKKRCAELDGLIRKLYEAYATEKLSEKRFETLSAGYEQEQAELEVAIAEDEEKLTAYDADTDRAGQFLTLARRYTDFSVLTNQMILEFIDGIVVHAAVKVDGEREQEVEIYLKFIGKFDVPLRPPTLEELAEQERKRKRRAYNREKQRLCQARKKQLEQEAKSS